MRPAGARARWRDLIAGSVPGCLSALLMALHPGPALADAMPVDLELMLAVDVSVSVDDEEFQLQRQGYVRALTHPLVIEAAMAGPLRRIAVSYVEWADTDLQIDVTGWRLLDGPESAKAIAAAIESAPALRGQFTAVGAVIEHAVQSFAGNRFAGTWQVLDVSGDGVANDGPAPRRARDKAVASGITINGLPLGRPGQDVTGHYAAEVVGGDGAFTLPAEDRDAFADAILAKLLREISWTGGPRAGTDR